jgi:hypothetical protein
MPDPRGTPKRLTLPDGSRVGIVDLEKILREVADLNLADAATIKAELLKRTALCNYVPACAETDYRIALFREYREKYQES